MLCSPGAGGEARALDMQAFGSFSRGRWVGPRERGTGPRRSRRHAPGAAAVLEFGIRPDRRDRGLEAVGTRGTVHPCAAADGGDRAFPAGVRPVRRRLRPVDPARAGVPRLALGCGGGQPRTRVGPDRPPRRLDLRPRLVRSRPALPSTRLRFARAGRRRPIFPSAGSARSPGGSSPGIRTCASTRSYCVWSPGGRWTATRRDGTWAFRGLPSGDYAVEVDRTTALGRAWRWGHAALVALEPGTEPAGIVFEVSTNR